MALTVNTNIINDTDQYLLDAKNVKGGFVVVSTTEERDALPAATTVEGSLCFCQEDNKFYQYNGSAWVEKIFGITSNASQSVAGLMSSTDKQKLDGIDEGANKTIVDTTLSASSTNPVQNKVVKSAIDAKANTSDLTSHTGNTTVHITADERTKWNAAKTHADTAHAPSDAEKNQNAFSNVKVGSATIAADSTTDTLELVAGTNITITPDATNDKITISSNDTHNSHAIISGKKADGTTDIKGPASAGDITLGDSGVTAGEYGPTSNQTPDYGATFNVPDIKVNSKGIVTSVTNRTVKIPASDNVDTGATSVEVTGTGNAITEASYDADSRKITLTKGATYNNYSLPAAGSSLGGVKTGGDVVISNGVITVNDDSHNHVISNVDGLQDALDAKADDHDHPYIPISQKGAANGVAELDANGKVPASQLPSYVDDVLEYTAKASFPTTGETGKIYVDTATNKTYRWSGSTYTEISTSLALGTTSSTAYYGDKGQTAYEHSQKTSGNPHGVTKDDIKLGNVVNTGDSATPIEGGTTKFTTGGAYIELAKKADKSSLATVATSGNYNDLTNKPTLGALASKSFIGTSDLDTTLQSSISKANSALQSFTEEDPTVGKHIKDITTGNISNWDTAYSHANKAHAPANAEKNQNAFSNVVIGSTAITADTTTDTLILAGSNVTLTPDANNDKVTIGITKDNVTNALGYTPLEKYDHPSYTARTGKPTANQTPAFGGTITVSQVTSDALGHVKSMTDRTITIPATLSNGIGTAGLIKTSSTVTDVSDYAACPVISGIPYYQALEEITVDEVKSAFTTAYEQAYPQ